MDLLSYWQLLERPFETVWDSRFFFASRAHEEVLHRLRYLAAERSMSVGLITGEIGCGKTLTCAVFREQLDLSQYCVAAFDHVRFTFEDVLLGLLEAIDEPVPPALGRYALWQTVGKALDRLAREGRHCLAIFDEAQDFDVETLRELKTLTNLNGHGIAPLTLIFTGQPELQDLIGAVPSLMQRVGLRFHLRSLTKEESDRYLAHRLRVAGHETGQVFAAAALEYLFEVSQGIPRRLNRLAKLAIEHAWVTGQDRVSRAAIEAIVDDDARHTLLAAV